LPEALQETPIIWFTGNRRAKGSYLHSSRVVLIIDTSFLDFQKLYPLPLREVNWWVYTGHIPPIAIEKITKSDT